jgi:hypothetical protein
MTERSSRLRNWRRGLFTLVAAALLLANAGCLFVAAGAAAAGGAAAVYAYSRGRLYRDYPVGLEESRRAVLTSLSELQFSLDKEEPTKEGLTITSRTGDGRPVTIDLETHVAPVPAEGTSTRIAVRVGTLGDEAVSARLLDQVDLHLAPPTRNAVPIGTTPPGAPTGRLQPVAAETQAPPLAK